MAQHERSPGRELELEFRRSAATAAGASSSFSRPSSFARSRRSRLRSASTTTTTSTTHSGLPRSPDADRPHYVFGRLEQKTHSLTLRVNYTMTPNLSLQVYGQPFVSAGHYVSYKELVNGRAERYEDRYAPYAYDGNADFNVLSFRTTNVLRWEYRPGSALFVVWQQGREGQGVPGRFALGQRLLGSLLHAIVQHAARQVRVLDEPLNRSAVHQPTRLYSAHAVRSGVRLPSPQRELRGREGALPLAAHGHSLRPSGDARRPGHHRCPARAQRCATRSTRFRSTPSARRRTTAPARISFLRRASARGRVRRGRRRAPAHRPQPQRHRHDDVPDAAAGVHRQAHRRQR